MRKKVYLMLLVLIAGYYFWSEVYVHSPEEALSKVQIYPGDTLHTVDVKDGIVMYYRENHGEKGICTAYIRKDPLTGWKCISGGGIAEIGQNADIS